MIEIATSAVRRSDNTLQTNLGVGETEDGLRSLALSCKPREKHLCSTRPRWTTLESVALLVIGLPPSFPRSLLRRGHDVALAVLLCRLRTNIAKQILPDHFNRALRPRFTGASLAPAIFSRAFLVADGSVSKRADGVDPSARATCQSISSDGFPLPRSISAKFRRELTLAAACSWVSPQAHRARLMLSPTCLRKLSRFCTPVGYAIQPISNQPLVKPCTILPFNPPSPIAAAARGVNRFDCAGEEP